MGSTKNADFIESTSVFDEFLEFVFKDGIVAARNAQLGTKQPIPRIDGIDGSLEKIRNMRSGNFQQVKAKQMGFVGSKTIFFLYS